MDRRGLNREWRFHDEMQPAIRPDQQREILIVPARPRHVEDSLYIFEQGVHLKHLSAGTPGFAQNYRGKFEPLARANRLMIMTGSRMQIDDALTNAYRTTFQEYARRLDALQNLMNSGTPDAARMDAALLEVEQARIAYNASRDQLAKELVRPPLPASTGTSATGNPATGNKEHRIRQTARLLWEVAGRPDGSAEHDWRRAEQLVRRAATSSCC
jgi:hypothetical protein